MVRLSRSKNKQKQGKSDRARPKQAKQVEPNAGVVEEQVDSTGSRVTVVVSVASIVGAALLLAFFFMSDISDKIIAAKNQPVYASDLDKSASKSDTSDTFHIAILSDDNVSKDAVIDYVKSMSDDTFHQFIQAITGDVKQTDADTDVLQDIPTTKAAMITYLKSMSEAEFDKFIASIVKVVSPEQLANLQDMATDTDQEQGDKADKKVTEKDKALNTTLKEAYAEAEKRFPGQIDGSKRLKLVQDLNAIDYKYYVAEQGDTLIELSNAFNVSLGQLVELNGIHDADEIPAGMIILFPLETEQPDLTKK